MKILGKCPNKECEGNIVEIECMGVYGEDTYDGVYARCDKCGEDFTDEYYG